MPELLRSKLLRNTSIAIASATILAGCTSETSPQAETTLPVATSTPKAGSEFQVPTVKPNPQIDAMLGSAISGEAVHIGNGLYQGTTHEIQNGFELDGADIALASFKCHPARTLEISPMQTDEDGDFYTAACTREGVPSNRPYTELITPSEGNDYSSLIPDALHEGMTAVAHPGDLRLEWDPAGNHTNIRISDGVQYEIVQKTVFDAMNTNK